MAEVIPSNFSNLREKIESKLTKVKAPNTSSKPDKSHKNPSTEDTRRGKKRSYNGQVLDQMTTVKKDTKSASIPAQSDTYDEEFKQIVAELGGGQEDFDLMQDAASDSEVEGEASKKPDTRQTETRKGKTLESGMANILKEIALAREAYQDTDVDQDAVEHEAREDVGIKSLAVELSVKSAPPALPAHTPDKKQRSRFICEPRPDWFNQGSKSTPYDATITSNPSPQSIEQIHKYARELLNKDNEVFQTSQNSSSSQAFYNTVIASGTLSDKISALTLAVQESPLHNLKALDGLLGLAKKRSRTQAVDVLRALKDLFAQGSLLPSDRHLFHFNTNPALLSPLGRAKTWHHGDPLPSGISNQDLVVWAYEDWLKEQYFEILKILESWSNDELEFSKTRATSYIYELLKEKPEQEANLLRLLINKLGDPVKKIASQASYLLMQLLASHPAMKAIVVSAIDTDFIFKPAQTIHAKYYAAVTLNQTALSMKEEGVAAKLLDIYFGLFKTILKPSKEKEGQATVKSETRHQRQKKRKPQEQGTDQEHEFKEKLISAVLTGINRAYPYCGTEHQRFNDHIDTLFLITHSANFNTSIQAMMLIQQLISTNAAPADRFYRTLYESLLDPRLITSSKQQLYLNLLHKSLKADLSTRRVKAFVKRILQILTLQEPPFICGAFYLLRDLEKSIPSLGGLIDQGEDHDDEDEVFKDVDEDADISTTIGAAVEVARDVYDPHKRDPEFAMADKSCAWDVLPFLSHYHPAVSISADLFVDHRNMIGKPDLSLHTLIHFLDRFVYKNAKVTGTKMRGSSIMQPMASDDTRAVLLSSSTKVNRLPVNSEAFRLKRDTDVAAEDVFFHQYFNNIGKPLTGKGEKSRRRADEDSSIASQDEDEIWKAMVDTAPELDGLEDDAAEDVSDLSELEAEMQDDEVSEALQDDSDGEVDIEAGIFDDSDDDLGSGEDPQDDGSTFEGLGTDEEDSQPSANAKRNREKREQKKQLKALPTFASAADYAKMLDDDADEDLG